MEDWYRVTQKIINDQGGSTLLTLHGNSIRNLLKSRFPDHSWHFPNELKMPPKPKLKDNYLEFLGIHAVTKGFWNNIDNRKQLIGWLVNRLSISKMSDWERVSLEHIESLAPLTPFRKYSLTSMLTEYYGDSFQIQDSQRKPKKAAQRMLALEIRTLFPQIEVKEDHIHPDLLYQSGERMELDIFVQHLNLAFEYQGQQHYEDVHALGHHKYYQERDQEKRKACHSKGITLIEIPYWWDGTVETLQATIHHFRSDLLSDNGYSPIPSIPINNNSKNSLVAIPKDWDNQCDLSGWYICPMEEGLRVLWDGNNLFTQHGVKIKCPLIFTKDFPKFPLDGILTSKFANSLVNQILHSKDESFWSSIQFILLDLPRSSEVFRQRLSMMKTMSLVPPISLLDGFYCENNQHIWRLIGSNDSFLARDPDRCYETGITDGFLKIHKWDESLVRVIEINDRGLKCQQTDGTSCNVSSSISSLNTSIIGKTIRVRHDGYHPGGSLRRAHLYQQDTGLDWTQFVDSSNNLQNPMIIADWTKLENRMQFFEWMTIMLNFKLLSDWYSVTRTDIRKCGGESLLNDYYHGSLLEALTKVYPSHRWLPWKFKFGLPQGYWNLLENQRTFLNWIQQELKFSTKEDWFKLTAMDIKQRGGSRLLLKYGSVNKLLNSVLRDFHWNFNLKRAKRKRGKINPMFFGLVGYQNDSKEGISFILGST
eukprot:TRINITY_DN2649_c0_g1_i2.p1 TRINITY_DN2649_c0_g1~~TRINITY_DN2649_c0_g1_i2.p1  ORF type:complete len:817 (-),score=149.57 TRINITY_DN2649_c0_g1_i2:621-2738(-)